MTSVTSMHEAGYPKQMPWDNPEGWGGEGSGWGIQDGRTHVQSWLIHVDIYMYMHVCKVYTVISLQLKLIISF